MTGKNRFKRLTALILAAAIIALLALSGCGGGGENITVGDFSVDEEYFVAGEEFTATFTAKIEGTADTVNLCRDNQIIGAMHDDGADGDVTANDGVYTYVLTDNADYEETASVDYYAECSGVKSESVTLYFFAQPKSETEAEQAQKELNALQKDIADIEKDYLDENGYVDVNSRSELIADMNEYLESSKSDEIARYEVENNSIYIKLKSGIAYIYEPPVADVNSGGDSEGIILTFSSYQPNPDVSDKKLSKLVNTLAKDFTSTSENFEGEEVTLSLINSLPSNQVVLWNGHGGYMTSTGSFLATGEYYSQDKWNNNTDGYRDDVTKDYIVVASTNEQSDLACITSGYIDNHCEDLSNDLFILSSCHSGQDSRFANALINKGAIGILGFSDTVYTAYCTKIANKTLTYMNSVDSNTNNYYTLSQALDKAKSELGNNDIEYAKKHPITFRNIKPETASPVIFGGDNANNYRLANYVPVKVDSFTIPDSKTLTIGELDIIEPEITPEDAENYTIKWSSSDESVVSVNPTGEYGILTSHSKGTATVTAELTDGQNTLTDTTEVRVASKGRDTVLVLDVSGSMGGTPLNEMKQSAVNFCDELLLDEYNNRVAIVCFDDDIQYYDFTDDLDSLKEYINNISDGGSTNMTAALEQAEYMMDTSGTDGHIKNIVIMADGLPNTGATSTSGSAGFDASVVGYDGYANAVVDTAESIMQKYNMYSLGFFHLLSGYEYDICSQLMSKLTNMTDGYHEVQEAENLQFEFGDIAEDITDGSKIIINIACPVDVSVTYDGETLSSASDDYNGKTSFGTLELLGSKQDVKVLSLDSDKTYDISLNGTGEGTMDYSVNYMNEEEEITDYRNFSSVPITETTVINSNTDNSTTVIMNVDSDGDGNIDIVYGAENNGEAVEIENNTETTVEPTTEEPTTEPETEEQTTEPQSEASDNNSLTVIVIVAASVIALLITAVIIILCLTRKKTDEQDIEEEKITVTDSEKISGKSKNKNTSSLSGDAYIEVLSGTMAGMKVPVNNKEVLALGKSPQLCQVVFEPSYQGVSRLHCTVTFEKQFNKFFVTDSSSNGTYRNNGIRLEKGKRTAVNNGETLCLCDNKCKIRLYTD